MAHPEFTDQDLRRNLRVYNWIRMLGARVFLPLIAVYLVDVAHLNIPQLGALAVVAAVMALLGNIPGGYLADHYTRRAALMTGSLLAALGTLIYVLWPSYPGAIMATAIDALGYAIMTGAGEALMHDSLVARQRAGEYVRLIGRAASFAMVGNLVLVGFVPLTYTVDKRLPFLWGTVAHCVFMLMVVALREPPRPAGQVLHPGQTSRRRRLVTALRYFVNRRTFGLFVAIGLLSAIYVAPVSFTNLARVDMGLPADKLGLMYAAASLVAAAGGWYLHHLNRLPFIAYAMLDILVAVTQPLTIGLTRNIELTIATFIIGMAFWRFRNIIYQEQLLRRFGNSRNKATLISVMGFFRDIQLLWLPLVFASVIMAQGYYTGLVIMSLATLIALPPLMLAGIQLWQRVPAADPPHKTTRS